MNNEQRLKIRQVLDKYDAIGGWWTYERDKVPNEIKIYVISEINQDKIISKNNEEYIKLFDKTSEEITQKMYNTYKPDLSRSFDLG